MTKAQAKLKELFGERGAQQTLAKATGINQGWLSRLAHDGDKTPNLADAVALEREAGIPISWWAIEEMTPVPERKNGSTG